MLQPSLPVGLTFDDVALVPAKSSVLPAETDTRTRLTRRITINIPIVSAAMDTVTEARLAIAIAREGGIGIIHRVVSPADQAAEVVNDRFELKGLITIKDIAKRIQYPDACKDEHGRLRVGAAVGVGEDADQRVALLSKAGVDVVVVDTAHGHSQAVLDTVRLLKRRLPEAEVVAGNVATKEAVRDLIAAGADAIKVGVGPGSN